jgi:hypothetical protein
VSEVTHPQHTLAKQIADFQHQSGYRKEQAGYDLILQLLINRNNMRMLELINSMYRCGQ